MLDDEKEDLLDSRPHSLVKGRRRRRRSRVLHSPYLNFDMLGASPLSAHGGRGKRRKTNQEQEEDEKGDLGDGGEQETGNRARRDLGLEREVIDLCSEPFQPPPPPAPPLRDTSPSGEGARGAHGTDGDEDHMLDEPGVATAVEGAGREVEDDIIDETFMEEEEVEELGEGSLGARGQADQGLRIDEPFLERKEEEELKEEGEPQGEALPGSNLNPQPEGEALPGSNLNPQPAAHHGPTLQDKQAQHADHGAPQHDPVKDDEDELHERRLDLSR